jgi:hypothetical protein
MKIKFVALLVVLFLLASCANPGVVKISDNVYLISKTDKAGIFGNASALKVEVIQEANQFAASQGKSIVPIELKESPLIVGQRFASIEYQFKLVDAKKDGQVTEDLSYKNSDKKLNEDNKKNISNNLLNPEKVKFNKSTDSVAIIIGIADYKNLPRADYANDDAKAFYQYAIRGLGVKAENIKLLVDGDADQTEIYRAFKTWLPTNVKSTTDVYVYYSGHGLPSSDGQSLYLLPQRADRDLIDETAISQAKINAALQAIKPKSVTIFLDSCYSGMARTGQTLLASARPITLKANAQVFPSEFTVITASQDNQISSSSSELKHGIFSYYLMKGMEGDADENKDGKITVGEMQIYLAEMVPRQAMKMNRKQMPQLTGDTNRVLVGR